MSTLARTELIEPMVVATEAGSKLVLKLGSIAAWIFLVYSLVTMVLLLTIGSLPETAAEGFAMLQANRLVGLLRMDILTILFIPLYYLIFFSIYIALEKTHGDYAKFVALLIFSGVTLILATPSALSFLALADKYAAATSATHQVQLLAAGEAILAADMWHGSGAIVGGLLLQTGALLFSILMLREPAFGKLLAYVGILTHGLDLVHIPVGLIVPGLGNAFMGMAGVLYLAWFPLLAIRLYRLSRPG